MKKKNIVEALRLEIKKQLSACRNDNATPKICKTIETRKGYRMIEDRIINLVIHDQITPAAAIGQIESEL